MQRPPNIVWITLDHLAFAHHYGRPAGPRMPTYERLCREGVSFSRAKSVCPLCTPARASMLTGVYPHRHGLVSNAGDCGSRKDFLPDASLIAAPLREAGYRVGYFGKWHCGEQWLPSDFGFEGWCMPNCFNNGYGNPYEAGEYEAYIAELGAEPARADVEWDRWQGRLTGRDVSLKQRSQLSFITASGVLRTPVETHETSFVAHLANRWIQDAAQGDDPFFVRVEPWGPHQAYLPAAPFAGSVDPRSIPEYPNFRRSFEGRPAHHALARGLCGIEGEHDWPEWQPVVARCYENIHMVDHILGSVLDLLETTGLADNTLVVYTADHGDLLAAQGGFIDKLWIMSEETMSIPLVLRWPRGGLTAGARREPLVSNMDLFPTVLEAAGAPVPEPCDGRSLLGTAREPNGDIWREDLMCQHHGSYGHRIAQGALYWKQFKWVANVGDRNELYDLDRDPFELVNRVDDPSLAPVRADMDARLSRRMAEVGDSVLGELSKIE